MNKFLLSALDLALQIAMDDGNKCVAKNVAKIIDMVREDEKLAIALRHATDDHMEDEKVNSEDA